MHRLVSAVDATGGKTLPELPDDRGLVGIRHRQVGGVPVAENPESLELAPLNVDEPLGILPALLAKLRGAELLLFRTEGLVDLKLYRQAVTIPPRDIWSIISLHTSRLYDNILKYFVEGVPDVDMSIGIRRTIVENIRRLAAALDTQRSIHTLRLPKLQHPGFAPRQIGLHREGRPGQVQRSFVVHRPAPLRYCHAQTPECFLYPEPPEMSKKQKCFDTSRPKRILARMVTSPFATHAAAPASRHFSTAFHQDTPTHTNTAFQHEEK